VNELFFFEERHKQLRESITTYTQFDQIALAQKCEGHARVEFRRIAAYLYKVNKRWEKSIELSKADDLWQDATETAAESKNQELAESLLYFFVGRGERECFAAALFTCYELIRPDVVLELAWRNQLTDYAMPYVIQSFRQFHDRLNNVSSKLEDELKKLAQKEKDSKNEAHDAQANPAHLGPAGPSIPWAQGPQMLALPAPPGTMPGVGMYGSMPMPMQPMPMQPMPPVGVMPMGMTGHGLPPLQPSQPTFPLS